MRATLQAGFVLILVLALGSPATAAPRTYLQDALIIPMDTTSQDLGMLEAYGLVYDLLRNDIPVDWVIAEAKSYGDTDFVATTEEIPSGLPLTNQGYRGGPFVVDSIYFGAALPVVQAWQVDHPDVAVHRVTSPFSANVSMELLAAPTIAVFADGKEDIAFGYLNAAAIPMSDGNPWPAKKDKNALYPCPGTTCCPDCLNETDAAGPTTTSHTDGALFDAGGVPRYCQFMSMHYKHPAPVPEVVAEVREFLTHPVHFLAECQAVNAFENDASGHFLTGDGLVAAGTPGAVDHYHSDDPFAQADGGYANPGGSEPAFSLDVGSYYYNANVVMVSAQGTPLGQDDIWMNGHMDDDPANGKVSYLGGHKYDVALPISASPKTQGTRYFLNALFEAPCSTSEGQPEVSTSVSGPEATNSNTYTTSVCYENSGTGIAFDAVLTLTLPTGATFASATDPGLESGNTVIWSLGSLPTDTHECIQVTVSFGAEGSYGFASTLTYNSGLNPYQVDSGTPQIVRFGHVNLLRYASVTQIAPQSPPNAEIFVNQHPVDPALDPLLDLEVMVFESGQGFPNDTVDLTPGSAALVFYELEGDSGSTLRVNEAGGRVVLSY